MIIQLARLALGHLKTFEVFTVIKEIGGDAQEFIETKVEIKDLEKPVSDLTDEAMSSGLVDHAADIFNHFDRLIEKVKPGTPVGS